MARNYTPVPDEWLDEMEELSDAEYGRLIRWCQRYTITGQAEKLPGNERFYQRRCMNAVDRFISNWEAAIEQKREAGRRGAAMRWNGTAMADDGTAKKNIAPPSPPMAPDSENGYTDTKTDTNTKTIDNSIVLSTRTRVREELKDKLEFAESTEEAAPPIILKTVKQGEPAGPRWDKADAALKDEVAHWVEAAFKLTAPKRQVTTADCVNAFNAMVSVDADGRAYVDAERRSALNRAMLEARSAGKPGSWSVINRALNEERGSL